MTNENMTTATTGTTEPKKTYRTFEIMQYEYNPKTGEDLHFNRAVIMKALAHKTIKQWIYVRHDRDKNDDGTPKAPHWHVYIYCNPAKSLDDISKWFGGVPTNMIELKVGNHSFLDCAEYFTHEKQPTKALYDDTKLYSNMPWRQMLNERDEKRAKYGDEDIQFRDQQRVDVLNFGKTLKQCKIDDPVLYVKEMQILKKCRLEYLYTQPVPKSRMNIYVTGQGGVGKGHTCKALARALYPELDDDEDIFFTIGAKNATFEGYDGQPVIIWDDRRDYSLLEELGGRENVFNVFDTIPQNLRQNIKYGSVKLLNAINIVNSVQPYTEFLDGLSGEYKAKDGTVYKSEDDQKQQSYRRFPFCIEVKNFSYVFYENQGFVNHDKKDYLHITSSVRRGNADEVHAYFTDRKKMREMEAKLFAYPIQTIKENMTYNRAKDFDENWFEHFGDDLTGIYYEL